MPAMKRRVLQTLLALGIALGGAGCGSASKTDTATSAESRIPPRAKQVTTIGSSCIGLIEASISWLKQDDLVFEGTPRQGDSLTLADEKSHQVEAAARKVGAAVPNASAAVARYITLVGTVRMLINEYDSHDIPGALDEVRPALARVAAACEASSKQHAH
jgi:hypothetical protein